jgi:hypothetical protein
MRGGAVSGLSCACETVRERATSRINYGTNEDLLNLVKSFRLVLASYATKIGLRILAIGLFAGTLDIADALIFNVLRGITPIQVLQYIASGLIGTASFRGGLASAGLGLVLHYLIAHRLADLRLNFSLSIGALSRPVLCDTFPWRLWCVVHRDSLLRSTSYDPNQTGPRRGC